MIHLLKKELSELLNKQMLLGLLLSFILIILFGSIMTSSVTETVDDTGEVHIIDQDQTNFTEQIKTHLEQQGYTVLIINENETENFESELSAHAWSDAVVLPEGFTDCLLNQHQLCQIQSLTELKTTSSIGIAFGNTGSAEIVSSAIKEILSETYLVDELSFIENPVEVTPYTIANGKIVQASSTALIGSLSMFDQLMPLILFLLIILTAQMIISAVATEKMDKTLETLLSSPVSRSTIICAKMLAALITALIYVIVYGSSFFIAMLFNVDNAADNINIAEAFTGLMNTQDALHTLGLQISFWGWIGVIAQLFLTICISLTASMILGGLVEDAKGSQTASMPILIFTTFPYILSMISDIRNMVSPVKYLLYCIPFTHTFIATGCLRFHNYGLFWGGMIYQLIFLAVIAFAALKLYQSDLLFTHQFASKKNKQS